MVQVVEDDLLFSSSIVTHEIFSQMNNQGEKKARRRRRARVADDAAKKQRLSDEQAKFLETSFAKERKLDSGRKLRLAEELGLDPKQVAVWFQNRRARHKSKQVEEAYLKLKTAHDAAVVEKYHLENEVLKLKDQLLRAGEEIRKLSLSSINGVPASNVADQTASSPSSSFSMVTQQPLLLEGFAAAAAAAEEEEYNFLYINDYAYNNNYVTDYWPNFYGI